MDDTVCDGNGSRTFCYPSGKQPFCQWLFHKEGACSLGFPDDNMYEVASISHSFHSGKPGVNKKLVTTYTDVDDFLDDFESLYRKRCPETPVLDLSELWTAFMGSLTREMKGWTKRWV